MSVEPNYPVASALSSRELLVSSAAESNRIGEVAASIFSKYAIVWIWSILFGASTAFVFQASSNQQIGKWSRGAGVIFGCLGLVSGLSALVATALLIRFLLRYILPLLSKNATPPLDTELHYHERSLALIGNLLILCLVSAVLANFGQALLAAFAF